MNLTGYDKQASSFLQPYQNRELNYIGYFNRFLTTL